MPTTAEAIDLNAAECALDGARRELADARDRLAQAGMPKASARAGFLAGLCLALAESLAPRFQAAAAALYESGDGPPY